MLCITFDGRLTLLNALTDNLDAYAHLYTNDVPIVAGLTRADLTEPRNPSYKPLAITRWTPAVLRGRFAVSYGETVQFSRTAAGKGYSVFGYFLTQDLNGPVLGVERGAHAPYAYTTATDRIQIFPSLSLPCPPHDPCPDAIVAGGGLQVTAGTGMLTYGTAGAVVSSAGEQILL